MWVGPLDRHLNVITISIQKPGYPSLKQRTTRYYCRALNDRDVFAILQTGFGKILCYACIAVLQGARLNLNGFSHHRFSQDSLTFSAILRVNCIGRSMAKTIVTIVI